MKKLIALLLALMLMLGLMAGCGDSGEENNPSSDPTASTGGDTTDPTAAPTYEGPIDTDTDDKVTYELPLVDDIYTFEWWLASSDSFEDFSSYADNEFYKWMEEQTNVHIDFNHPAAGSESESFKTMVLSGDYPDFVHNIKNYYDGGVDKAIADGFLLPLNEHIHKMPNYQEVVYGTEETFIQAVSDEGNLWGIHHIVDRPQGSWIGLGIREDWLNELGLTTADVETVDGLENVLTQFKDKTYDGVGPLWLSSGNATVSGGLSGSYGFTNINTSGSFVNVNGTAVYSPLQPGFKDYVAKMADWYAKGLIHKDYIAAASWSTPEERWVNSETGVGDFIYTNEAQFATAAAVSDLMPDPDFDLAAIPSPKLNESDDWSDIHIRNTQPKIRNGNSMGITTQCSDLDIAFGYWNHVWSEEGKHASNWGSIEGEYGDTNAHYYVDPTDANGDGHVECYQPWMMEKWNNVTYVQVKFAVHNGPTWSIWSREWCTLSPEELEYQDQWNLVADDYVWPEGVTLTATEGEQASSIVSTCNTQVNTWVAEVITGVKSVDTYETEIVPFLNENRIDEATGYYQAALTRYNTRIEYMGQ